MGKKIAWTDEAKANLRAIDSCPRMIRKLGCCGEKCILAVAFD